jgi:hypothetical protein
LTEEGVAIEFDAQPLQPREPSYINALHGVLSLERQLAAKLSDKSLQSKILEHTKECFK